MSDVRKSSTCYHLFEPQDIFFLGSGPLLCTTIPGSGTCMGHQLQVPNLGFCHLISSPCCSLSTYWLCCSYYRFSVLKHFRHCLLHMHFTTQPPSRFIRHYCSLPSLLQFAIWKHSRHRVTHMFFKASPARMVPLFSCHLSDHCHASHGSSFLVCILRWTA
jgi:hypothetical protein